jgi:rod shape-determining protein MreD
VSPIRIGYSLVFFFILFAVQESAISLIHFPVAGFSLYLAVAIALIAYEDHDGAIIMGFLSGIVLDLSPTSNGPFGQWALILTLIGYVFASNRESIFDATSAPLTFVLLIAFGVSAALIFYLFFGLLLGEANGSFTHDIVLILGNLVWTVIFAPMFLPVMRSFQKALSTSRQSK